MGSIRIGSALLTLALLYVMAVIGGILAFVCLGGDVVDQLGVAMLLPIFIMPAFAFLVLSRVWDVRPSYRHLWFWLLFPPVPLLLIGLAIRDYFVPFGEGHGLAILLAIPLLAGGVTAYGGALIWEAAR